MPLLLYGLVFSLLFGHLPSVFLASRVYLALHDGLILLWIIFFFTSKHAFRKHTLFVPVILFLSICLFSLVINSATLPRMVLLEGFLYFVRFFVYCLFFLCLSSYYSYRKDLLIIFLYGVGVLFSIIGIIQVLLYPSLQNLLYLGWDPHYYRLFSTFFDPNFAGIFIVLTILLGFFLSKQFPKWLFFLCQIILLSSLIMTYSRSSYLALGICMVIWFIKSKSWNSIIYLILGIFIFMYLPKTQLDVIRLDRWQSTIVRYENWKYALNLIKDKPIFGYGFNTLSFFRPGSQGENSRAGAGLDNSFLFIWAATGIIGLISFFWILVRINSISVKKDIFANQGNGKTLLLTVIVSICIHSLFNNSWFYPWIVLWVWILVAALIDPIFDR